jgi:hypothetical protein
VMAPDMESIMSFCVVSEHELKICSRTGSLSFCYTKRGVCLPGLYRLTIIISDVCCPIHHCTHCYSLIRSNQTIAQCTRISRPW